MGFRNGKGRTRGDGSFHPRRFSSKVHGARAKSKGRKEERKGLSIFSLPRGSRVFLTRVTRPLSAFQIRNTLDTEGFPISPFHSARGGTGNIENAAKQRNSDVIRPRRRGVYVLEKLFNVMHPAGGRRPQKSVILTSGHGENLNREGKPVAFPPFRNHIRIFNVDYRALTP